MYKDYENSLDVLLPTMDKDQTITSNEIVDEQHFTKPPARYTEAKLIKELEELGIGRPSTYATIMETIRQRDYVVMEEKRFKPTEMGIETTDRLQEYFSNIINVEYTANMEEDLDKVAEGKEDEIKLLHTFYDEFEPLVKTAFSSMEKKAPEETGEKCPDCGNPLVVRKGKYGSFVACSNYPTCKYIKKEEKQEVEVCDCPNCDGKIIERKSKRGKVFYGCNHFPKCKTAYWDKPIGELCPECKSMLVEGKDGIKCSSCTYKK